MQYLHVKILSGEIMKVCVNRLIYIASYKNTPGFIVRFKGEKLIKKESTIRFIPAITWEEYVDKRGY